MSYADDIRTKIYGEFCPENTVNAAIYARVSTNNEGQKESCDNQVAYAMNYIEQHPNIVLKGLYMDKGISGKNDDNRPEYQKMLKAIEDGKIQVVIIKDYSRSNRSRNSFELEDILVENDATFINLANGQIEDLEDPDAAFARHIQYLVDADYVKRQSRKGRITQKIRCDNKILSAKDCSYGYSWIRESKTIEINPREAEVVQRIFRDYVYKMKTPSRIEKELKAEGISICNASIKNILKDERYIGNFYINKVTSVLGTGRKHTKRVKLDKKDWVLCERPELRIIDDDLFTMAQRIHDMKVTVYDKPDKKETQARFQGRKLFAGKVFCPVCGRPYQHDFHDRNRTYPRYRIKSHADCPNPIHSIDEKDLIEITKRALKQTIEQQNDVCDSLEQLLSDVVKNSQNNGEEIQKLKKHLSTQQKKVDNLIDQLSEGGLTEVANIRIKEKINSITEEIDKLTITIKDKESNKLDESYVSNTMDSIRAAIADLRCFTDFDRDRILNYVERIDMPPSGDIELLLRSGQMIVANPLKTEGLSNQDNVGKLSKQGAPH